MPITFSCQCGRQLQMGDEYAGKKARCPECQAVVTVPFTDAPADPFAAPAFAPPAASAPAPPPPKWDRREDPEPHPNDVAATSDSLNPLEARSRSRRRDEEEDDRPRRRRRNDDEDDYDDRPRRRKESPPRKLMNSNTVGGIISLGIAFILVVLAVSAGIIFVKGIIILTIAGIIGVIRGLVTGRDE